MSRRPVPAASVRVAAANGAPPSILDFREGLAAYDNGAPFGAPFMLPAADGGRPYTLYGAQPPFGVHPGYGTQPPAAVHPGFAVQPGYSAQQAYGAAQQAYNPQQAYGAVAAHGAGCQCPSCGTAQAAAAFPQLHAELAAAQALAAAQPRAPRARKPRQPRQQSVDVGSEIRKCIQRRSTEGLYE